MRRGDSIGRWVSETFCETSLSLAISVLSAYSSIPLQRSSTFGGASPATPTRDEPHLTAVRTYLCTNDLI